MRSFFGPFIFFLTVPLYGAPDPLAAVRSDLQHLAIDSTQTFRVRELELNEGGSKIYLTEGVLAFATPVNGHRIAAVFTTEPVEAGDAEIIALPPVPAERASLARFAGSPNLDEHFTSALFFFADETAEGLLKQIRNHPLHPAPDLAADLGMKLNDGLRKSAAQIDIRIAQAILDHHRAENSFFYGMFAGRTLGPFDFVFQPDQPDSLVFGRFIAAAAAPEQTNFQMWATYQPKDIPEPAAVYHLSDYHIDTTIHPDLSMSSKADFDYRADADDGRVITLLLTPHLRVTSATIDGNAAAFLMHNIARTVDVKGAATFLLVSATDLTPGSHHRVIVQYEGSVIRRTADGAYFVDDRNVWYPFMTPMLTTFDLTFHCPKELQLVATGDPMSDEVTNGERTVHFRTTRTQSLAGFNLGDFNVATTERPPYRIEICSIPQAAPSPDLAEQTGQILEYFTKQWMPLPGHNIAVTPIEGYFGQGFPGLIYLSSISYIRERDRPQGLRNPSMDTFFSQLLLPHELAHQWWGNIVAPGDYRSNWIVEAMSNYSALQYLAQTEGKAVFDSILAGYRADLTTPRKNGQLVDSYGPVTFDQRLYNNFGPGIWHDILYEKGTWIFHMLRQRMGDSAFHEFQVRLLKDFANRPISNEEMRAEATHFMPPTEPDRQLSAFFDAWIYDTGIPTLALRKGSVVVSGVPDSYTVDLPLQCGSSQKWFRATEGETQVPRGCGLPPASGFLFRN